MNKIAEALKLLDLEVCERFRIHGEDNEYQIDRNGIVHYVDGGRCKVSIVRLHELLSGHVNIAKIPWLPEDGDKYYYVDFYCRNDIEICGDTWTSEEPDKYRYLLGNCFRTEKEAKMQSDKLLKEYKHRLKAKNPYVVIYNE